MVNVARFTSQRLIGNHFLGVAQQRVFYLLPPPLGNYATLTTNACYPMCE